MKRKRSTVWEQPLETLAVRCFHLLPRLDPVLNIDVAQPFNLFLEARNELDGVLPELVSVASTVHPHMPLEDVANRLIHSQHRDDQLLHLGWRLSKYGRADVHPHRRVIGILLHDLVEAVRFAAVEQGVLLKEDRVVRRLIEQHLVERQQRRLGVPRVAGDDNVLRDP